MHVVQEQSQARHQTFRLIYLEMQFNALEKVVVQQCFI